jgi:dihydrofolate synthase / folylpolyglutamate synthase
MERQAVQPYQMATYEEAVQWITGLYPFGIRPGLERIEALLENFKRPERRLKFIHVAGTNGKGSVCSYLTHVLLKSGYDVGTFTSPYITKFTNRMQYNGEDIPEETLLDLANQVRPFVEQMAETELGSPTMFEVTTLIAILYYATVAYPDFVVWETGLGGRLDVTNVVHPVVSVITNIGHDHMDKLGNSIEAIAFEKAGIIKNGVPVVVGVTQPEAIEVIANMAKERKSTMYLYNKDFEQVPLYVDEVEQQFRFEGVFRHIDEVTIHLIGDHQRQNAAVALMTIEVLRQYYATVIDDEALLSGMAETKWAGRLELIQQSPKLLIDGAHNPEGAEALAKALKHTFKYEKLHVMMGMINSKSHFETLKHILPLAHTIILTEAKYPTALPAEDLKQIAEEVIAQGLYPLKPNVLVYKEWKEGLEALQKLTHEQDLALVTGTLYLIGDVRSHLMYKKDAEKGW